MNDGRRPEIVLASRVLAGTVLLLGVVIYLAFLVPKLVDAWAQQDRRLNWGELLLARLSSLCQHLGLPLLVVLLLASAGSVVWLATAVYRARTQPVSSSGERMPSPRRW